MVREALSLDRLDALPPDEAAACLVTLEAEGLAPAEAELLRLWTDARPENARAYARAVRAWRVLEDAGTDEIILAIRQRARADRPSRRVGWQRGLAVAAMLVLVVGATLFGFPQFRPWGPGGDGKAGETAFRYASARGAVKEIILPDGSRLSLDADSAVDGRFSSSGRQLRLLKGRAFFAVAHDRNRPFEVAATGYRVVAVGTRFDVNLAGGALTVTLVEGRLTVGPADRRVQPAFLEAGQRLVLRNGAAVIRPLDDAAGAVGWKTGLLEFDDVTLAEAADMANRYSERQISIRDARVRALRVSGRFRAGDVQTFAESVAELRGLRLVQHGKEIELRR